MSSIEHLITVADLEKFPDDDGNRYELIEGELYVSTAPGLSHQLVLVNLLSAFISYLKTNPIGKIVPGAVAVFSNFDAVIPDLVFVSNERWLRLSQMIDSTRRQISLSRFSHPSLRTGGAIWSPSIASITSTAFKNIGLSIRRISRSCCIGTSNLTK